MKVIDEGLIRESSDIIAADRLIKMKGTSDVWAVIEEIIKIWTTKHPAKWDSYLVHLSDIKRTRKDQKYASTTDKVTGGVLRYTVDVPFQVYKMIRALYPEQELNMNTRFFHTFAKKFPIFRIAQKI